MSNFLNFPKAHSHFILAIGRLLCPPKLKFVQVAIAYPLLSVSEIRRSFMLKHCFPSVAFQTTLLLRIPLIAQVGSKVTESVSVGLHISRASARSIFGMLFGHLGLPKFDPDNTVHLEGMWTISLQCMNWGMLKK